MYRIGIGGILLYAYREQISQRNLYVLPKKQSSRRVVKKKRVSVKKKNPIKELFRQAVSAVFLLIFGFGICPHSFNNIIKPAFLPFELNLKSDYKVSKDFNKPVVNVYSLLNPVTNYVYNDMFNNYQLLTPTIDKKHSEVSTMYQTREIAGLKGSLMNLMAQYKTIKPSIYVWEYEQGEYVDINSDKLYSAASIIKLPVLVRLFKSIEANQLTIYDEMTMTEQYRSSGSGNMQYEPAGKSYTIDYLAKVMIQDSDNTSTNMLMSKLGGMDDINIGLRDWGISSTYVRTWLPDLEGTNKTTAKDMAKILYNLDNPGFLNVNSREYIIDYMSHVKNNRLIQAGLGEGALFIHKTGDIGTMLGDAGIVYAPNGKKYIVVILAERPYNSPAGKDFIVKASEIIYKAIVG